MNELKLLLDEKVNKYNCKEFIKNDPVQFVHAFCTKKDIETVALLASVIAWGNRTMIIRSGKKMFFDIMDGAPYDYVMNGNWAQLDANANIHRTFFVRDFIYLCRGLQNIYSRYDSIEQLFMGCDTWSGISRLRGEIAQANDGECTKHLSNPDKSPGHPASACKRLHMMLRWLCRTDGIVDVGLWNNVPPSQLMIPLDVHVARVGRTLGLITRKQNDRGTVEELTNRLREYSPDDPAKYDFALFGIGIEGIDKEIKI